jgi:hypothetical protein
MKLLPLEIMQQSQIKQEQLDKIHQEIYGASSSNSPISIQLRKLERCLQANNRVNNHEVFDHFR